jgi:hypothetical protein
MFLRGGDEADFLTELTELTKFIGGNLIGDFFLFSSSGVAATRV